MSCLPPPPKANNTTQLPNCKVNGSDPRILRKVDEFPCGLSLKLPLRRGKEVEPSEVASFSKAQRSSGKVPDGTRDVARAKPESGNVKFLKIGI